jgi:hypothetical protein
VPPLNGRIDSDFGMRLAAFEGGAAVYMLNLLEYRPAAYDGGWHDHCVNGRGVIDHAVAASGGAAVCLLADVIVSRGNWDRVVVVRYPSRSFLADTVSRRDFQDGRLHGEASMDQTIVIGRPAGRLPGRAKPSEVLLELWTGRAPEPVAEGPATIFDIENTIAGDGRRWNGARYTLLSPGTPLPLRPHQPGYEALLLAPAIERWQ